MSFMPEPDFRVSAYLEAAKCLKLASKLTVEEPLMWANLLGGIANLMVAGMPEGLVSAVDDYRAEKRRATERILEHLKRDD